MWGQRSSKGQWPLVQFFAKTVTVPTYFDVFSGETRGLRTTLFCFGYMPPCLWKQGIYFLRFFPTDAGDFTFLVGFFIDAGGFACFAGEREKKCPGGRLPLNAGELEALRKVYFLENICSNFHNHSVMSVIGTTDKSQMCFFSHLIHLPVKPLCKW